ncbi:MAG: RidA family protein [Dehalococcoidia bacterium]|nr:RidA family protein [Dehalococcoidia bacterium]
MKNISAEQAPEAIGPYSHANEAGGMLYLSGQIPLEPKTGELIQGNIAAQTEQTIHNIKAVLKAAGSDISRVVKSTCFLTDMNDFTEFNNVYARHFTSKPARSCVAVSALPRGSRVEIEVIAELCQTT